MLSPSPAASAAVLPLIAAQTSSDEDEDDEDDSDEHDDDEDGEEEEEDDEDEDTSMSVLEWTVGAVDLANSLMGLIIDASDDVDFLSSLGLLPEWVGDTAGTVSSYLWLVSGAIDVAMCCYKLREYRLEMEETIREQADELRRRERKRIKQLAAQGLIMQPSTDSAAAKVDSSYCALHCCEEALDSLAGSLPPPRRLNATVSAPDCAVSLCTSECDVDCFHIEWLRLFRYIGEMGLSVCGVLDLWDVRSPALEALLEASGVVSGIATLVKRGATHARSNKARGKHLTRQAGEPTDAQLYE